MCGRLSSCGVGSGACALPSCGVWAQGRVCSLVAGCGLRSVCALVVLWAQERVLFSYCMDSGACVLSSCGVSSGVCALSSCGAWAQFPNQRLNLCPSDWKMNS